MDDPVKQELLTDLFGKHFRYSVLLCSMANPADADRLAKALVSISKLNHTSLALLNAVIRDEFERTVTRPGSILRGNTIASKMMGSYVQEVGRKYLQDVLAPKIISLLESDVDYELNPERIQLPVTERPGFMQERADELIGFATQLLDHLLSAEVRSRLPSEIRAVSYCVREHARSFGVSEQAASLVGGFVFLRFFVPAVVAPESQCLLPEGVRVSSMHRRNLSLLGKLLQNLANNVLFGAKEEYMVIVNPFIHTNRDRMIEYLEDVCMDPRVAQGSETPWVELTQTAHQMPPSEEIATCDSRHFDLLHRILAQKHTQIHEALSPPPSDPPTQDTAQSPTQTSEETPAPATPTATATVEPASRPEGEGDSVEVQVPTTARGEAPELPPLEAAEENTLALRDFERLMKTLGPYQAPPPSTPSRISPASPMRHEGSPLLSGSASSDNDEKTTRCCPCTIL
eukprot:gnl/Trimastix_PCT/1954.p1 GENE.gnl/Trimastix_PCT/1954~~gnl/Trimastix_PCT/1954.p1  ORF type:complete len:473 (+),score=92.72 gnl/Trimastix_PCT/1954:46-1419(+)